MEKRCTRCGVTKPLTAFPKNATKTGCRDSECKRCKRARESTPEARAAKRARALFRRYGITQAEYDEMVRRQGNRCAICGEPERRTNRYGEVLPLAVDHDHKTGKVRGLLCSKHNKALGLFGDIPGMLESAIRYLRETQWNEQSSSMPTA